MFITEYITTLNNTKKYKEKNNNNNENNSKLDNNTLQYIIYFSIIIFFISFFSDFILNILSRITDTNSIFYSNIIVSLLPYFTSKHPFYAGFLAGITILFAFFLLLFLSKFLFGFYIPSIKNIFNIDIINYLVLAFVLGYGIDVMIEKTDLFGSGLHAYYKVAGSGLWGSLAFVFAILITIMVFWSGIL
jgi:hypothetical protein